MTDNEIDRILLHWLNPGHRSLDKVPVGVISSRMYHLILHGYIRPGALGPGWLKHHGRRNISYLRTEAGDVLFDELTEQSRRQ
jgi:hypothetical protein